VLIVDAANGTGIVIEFGSVFDTYDLQSSLGPITGTGGPASGSHMTPVFPTTAGDFTWAIGQTDGTLSSTFTATVAFVCSSFSCCVPGANTSRTILSV